MFILVKWPPGSLARLIHRAQNGQLPAPASWPSSVDEAFLLLLSSQCAQGFFPLCNRANASLPFLYQAGRLAVLNG